MMKRIVCWIFFLAMVLLLTGSAGMAAQRSQDAVVTAIQGSARIYHAGSNRGHLAKKGSLIKRNQEVRVGEKSRIEITFPDGTVLRLAENSRLSMSEVQYDKKTQNKKFKVGLDIGRLWAKVKKLVTPDSSVEVKTVNAVAGVRGTVYRVNVAEDNSAMVKVYNGSVTVSGTQKGEKGKTGQYSPPVPVPGPHEVPPPYHEVSLKEWVVIVKAMQEVTISPQGVASQPKDFDPKADADDWVKWNQERDKKLSF